MSRRRSHVVTVVFVVVLATLAAACGDTRTGAGASGGNSSTLRVALSTTMNPDPDVYFLLEGAMVTNAVYDGLVRHTPGTTKIEGVLAKSWTISPDGLTYTFTLRDGIRFADGTPIDSKAVEAAFKRRTAVGSSPSYMLAEVAGYATPDPKTFIVKLTKPVNNFMYRLASPWGPMVTNVAQITKDAPPSDQQGQTWMKTHSAGSGPYVISSLEPDQQIVLNRNDNYWGPKPAYKTVVFKIIDDASTQRLQIERGDLDAVQNLGTVASRALAKNDQLQVLPMTGFIMNMWQVNITHPPLSDVKVRQALEQSLPIKQSLSDIYGNYATPAKQMIPAGRMPPQYATYNPTYDPGALRRVVATLPSSETSRPVVVASPTIDNGEFAREADYMSETLRNAGLKVSEVKITDSQYFDYFTKPQQAPDLYVSAQPDDGSHPDNWFRLFLYSKGALAYGGIGTKQSDALMDEANATPPSKGIPYALYSQASDILRDQVHLIPMADLKDVWILRKGIEGAAVQLPSPEALIIADLKPAK